MATTYQRRLTFFSVMPALQIPLGIWLLASPYLLEFAIYDAARISAAAVGPFIVGFGITRLAVDPPWRWVGWINVLLGLWTAAVPFVFGLTFVTDLTITFLAVGVLTIVTSILGQFEPTETVDE